jgi:hypothetical protein
MLMLYEVNSVTREIRPRTPGFRAFAGAVLLVLGAATAGRTYCPMPPPSPTTDEQAGAHDCCKQGLTGAKPGCCHADSVTVAAILLKSASVVTLAAASSWMVSLPVEAGSLFASATSAVASHSPPSRVLRI